MKVVIVMFLCVAGLAEEAGKKGEATQKLEFDEVVVQTMDRGQTSVGTVGVIERKGKSKAGYRKKTDFSDRTADDLKTLKEIW